MRTTYVVALQGYAVGNGVTDDEVDGNAIIPFAYGKALLSTDLYTEVVHECQGNFWNTTKGNTFACVTAAASRSHPIRHFACFQRRPVLALMNALLWTRV